MMPNDMHVSTAPHFLHCLIFAEFHYMRTPDCLEIKPLTYAQFCPLLAGTGDSDSDASPDFKILEERRDWLARDYVKRHQRRQHENRVPDIKNSYDVWIYNDDLAEDMDQTDSSDRSSLKSPQKASKFFDFF